MRFVFHRYNVPDPVLFYESIQVTVQHIGSMSPNARQKWLAAGRKIPCAGAATGFRMDESVEPWGLYKGQGDWSGCAHSSPDRQ